MSLGGDAHFQERRKANRGQENHRYLAKGEKRRMEGTASITSHFSFEQPNYQKIQKIAKLSKIRKSYENAICIRTKDKRIATNGNDGHIFDIIN